MSKLNTAFYVVGDIEERVNLFNDAIECIALARREHVPVVFLGDIIDNNNIKQSASSIIKLLSLLGVPISKHLNSDSTIADVRRRFEIVYSSKVISAYKSKSKLFIRSDDPHCLDALIEKGGYDLSKQKQPLYLFILGNKEVDFIKDMSTLKMGLIRDGVFSTSFSYSYKNTRDEPRNFSSTQINITLDELNALLAYLNLCRSYVIWNDILLSHVYSNALAIRTSLFALTQRRVSKLICGHHRCFGQYYDSKYKNIDRVFLLDLSSERDDIPIKNYLSVSRDGDVAFYSDDYLLRKLVSTPMNARSTFMGFASFPNSSFGLPTEQMFIREIRKTRRSGDDIVAPRESSITSSSCSEEIVE